MKIAIIGGGLAGCALAYALKQAGESPVVYEAGPALASGASGNSTGLYNPRFTAQRSPESDYYSSAFSLALRTFKMFKDVEWNPCGALHLINDEKKEKRFAQTVKNWCWDPDHLRLVDHDEASDIAGVQIRQDALYLPQSGSVSPQKLCEAYMNDIDFHLNAPVEDLGTIDADVKILACGPAVENFAPDLPVGKVRGQITEVSSTPASEKVKCTICYGGYFSPAMNGQHIVGSSFQRWLDHSDVIEQDNEDNIQKLAGNVDGLAEGLKVIGQRASVRATSKDHFPIVGQLNDGLYISAAHGSHGILSSLMAAQLLSDMILAHPYCLPSDTIEALSPARFF